MKTKTLLISTVIAIGFANTGQVAGSIPDYRPIAVTSDATIELTGKTLSLEDLIKIARYGAKVRISGEAAAQQALNYGLLLEAQLEGVPVYLLNRGGGIEHATVTLRGDPLSPANRRIIEARELKAFEDGASAGDGPEVAEEEIVRATMAIRANQLIWETPSPQLAAMQMEMLNRDVTPVMQSRGTVGESDYNLIPNIAAAMVGKGDAYYRGVRMPAARALAASGLAALKPFGIDSSTLANSNGYTTALAALAVVQARHVLEWIDLAHALDLNAMNGNLSPLSAPARAARPIAASEQDASRVLDLLRGSYLTKIDPRRPLLDADSLRASAIRQGAAWKAWAMLAADVVDQMNSSDHNPAVVAGMSTTDAWELSTPYMMQYYIKGGPYSKGTHGYIVATANWDPYPLVNDLEAFTNALVNAGVAVTQRIYRFDNPFFTGVKPADLVHGDLHRLQPQANPILVATLWQELQMLANPVPAAGISSDTQGNADLQSQAGIKVARVREATDLMMRLVGQDLLTGTFWTHLRRVQDPTRHFGAACDALITAFAGIIPFDAPSHTPTGKPAVLAYEFVRDHDAGGFTSMPRSE